MDDHDFTQTGIDTSQQIEPSMRNAFPYQILAPGQTGVLPQIILLGDSITQQSTLTVQSRLQTLYIRRADIVNRGFSGYTAPLALSSLPYFLPISGLQQPSTQATVSLLTVFFGANDACIPGNFQHVPLSEFTAALRQIVEYPVFSKNGTKIVLITPGPVDEWQLEKPLTRTAANAKRYAEGVRRLAEELNLPCVDLWSAFTKLAGYCPEQEELPGSLAAPRNETLSTLLHDGLHFAQRGYDVLFEELMAVIQEQIHECSPENMPYIFEDWKVIRDAASETPIPAKLDDDRKIQLPPQLDDKNTTLSKSESDSENSLEEPEKKRVKATAADD